MLDDIKLLGMVVLFLYIYTANNHTLVTQTADVVDLKDGLLSTRTCALRNPVVKSFFHVNTAVTALPGEP